MTRRVRANTAIDQNGRAGISSSAPIATSAPTKIAKYRPKAPPWNREGRDQLEEPEEWLRPGRED